MAVLPATAAVRSAVSRVMVPGGRTRAAGTDDRSGPDRPAEERAPAPLLSPRPRSRVPVAATAAEECERPVTGRRPPRFGLGVVLPGSPRRTRSSRQESPRVSSAQLPTAIGSAGSRSHQTQRQATPGHEGTRGPARQSPLDHIGAQPGPFPGRGKSVTDVQHGRCTRYFASAHGAGAAPWSSSGSGLVSCVVRSGSVRILAVARHSRPRVRPLAVANRHDVCRSVNSSGISPTWLSSGRPGGSGAAARVPASGGTAVPGWPGRRRTPRTGIRINAVAT
jgi:hypothetical protein